MRRFALLVCFLPAVLAASTEWVLIRTTDGAQVEGQTNWSGIAVSVDGKPRKFRAADVLSVHNGAAATDTETARINEGLAAIQGKDRQARDKAGEELVAIGVPVLTPLLKTLKDTDQHEPRPLYRLFERIMPSKADQFDRSPSLIRLHDGSFLRVALPEGDLQIRPASGEAKSIPWSSIRALAIRKKSVHRSMPIHSLRHCNQIEYLDTGVTTTADSRLDIQAEGFARFSWNEDGWASDPNGLTKPGSPAYKTHLVGGHPFGALIGRIGAAGEVFFVGKKASKSNAGAGRVGLAVNDNAHWQNNVGTYSVTMTATNAYDLGEAQ